MYGSIIKAERKVQGVNHFTDEVWRFSKAINKRI